MESKFIYRKLRSEMEGTSNSSKKGEIKGKTLNQLKEVMQKRHERVPMDKKLEALSVCFYKITHKNYKLNIRFFKYYI